MPTPHAHSLRNIPYLHASRLPFKRAFTFASAHAPESLHNCARSSRDAHLASSSLHCTQTAMFPAPSAPPSAPPRAMFGARVRSRQPAEQNMLSPSGHGEQDRRRPDRQSLCESYFGVTRVDGGGVHTPHERERWPAIDSDSRREWSHHITPAIPTGGDPSPIRHKNHVTFKGKGAELPPPQINSLASPHRPLASYSSLESLRREYL
jgi:hypothetical protein